MVIKTLAMFNWLGLRPNFFTSELVEVQIPPGYFDFFADSKCPILGLSNEVSVLPEILWKDG